MPRIKPTDKQIFGVDIDPGDVFKKYLARVTKKSGDLSFSMGEAARIIKKESTANFILKGTGKYAPLSAEYIKRKSKLAPGASILVGARPKGGISGKLRDSIIGKTSSSVLRVGKLSLDIGTKAKSKKGAPYPKFVQKGTSKMPARKFLFLTAKMIKRIISTFDDELTKDWETA